MLAITAVLSTAIGVVLGLLGGGGAILMLPMLVYAARVAPRPAIASSLFVVGATSIVGAAFHARRGAVQWRVGSLFGAAAMTGAFAGGRVARYVPPEFLLVTFAIVMLVTAVAMMRGRSEASVRGKLAPGRALALGAAVGVLSGLVGAGGGFLIVPALTIFGGLAMREAVGTSLFVIALQSFAGFAGQATAIELDWRLIVVVTAASVLGAVVGTRVARRVSAAGLRRSFAWLVLSMGLFVIGKQVNLAVTALVVALTVAVVFMVVRTKPRATAIQ